MRRSFFSPLMAMPLVVLLMLVVLLLNRPIETEGFPVAAAFALPLMVLLSGLVLTLRAERIALPKPARPSLRRPG